MTRLPFFPAILTVAPRTIKAGGRSAAGEALQRLPPIVAVFLMVGVASVPGELEVLLVPHLVHHSPTGMEFGYAGSGPADLALSLLTFHLEADPVMVKHLLVGSNLYRESLSEHGSAVRVVQLYERFTHHALAGHGDDALDLTGWGINQWIEMTERKEAATAVQRALSVGSRGGTT